VIHQIEKILEHSVPIARLLGPHGLRGEIKATMLANYPGVFETGKEFFLFHLKKRSHLRCTLDAFHRRGDRMILRFRNYDHIDLAKELEGYEVYLDLCDLPLLKAGEYYFFQLLGASVYDEQGQRLGVVEDVIETGSADVLSIRKPFSGPGDPPKDSELLVPMAKDFLVSMDLEQKRLVIRPPVYMAVKDDETDAGSDEGF